MDAVEYLKELERMVKTDHVATKKYYSDCSKYQEAVNFVEQWSKTHPKKTKLQDFLEKHPCAILDEDGIPIICAGEIGYCDSNCEVKLSCYECWNEPLEE